MGATFEARLFETRKAGATRAAAEVTEAQDMLCVGSSCVDACAVNRAE